MTVVYDTGDSPQKNSRRGSRYRVEYLDVFGDWEPSALGSSPFKWVAVWMASAPVGGGGMRYRVVDTWQEDDNG